MLFIPQPGREVIFLQLSQVTEHFNITGTSQQLGSSIKPDSNVNLYVRLTVVESVTHYEAPNVF